MMHVWPENLKKESGCVEAEYDRFSDDSISAKGMAITVRSIHHDRLQIVLF